MKIAIFGSTSEIAIDLIYSFIKHTDFECILFSRDNKRCKEKLNIAKNHYSFLEYDDFTKADSFDVIINFIGVGSPIKAKNIGKDIVGVTQKYDSIILDYLSAHKESRYIYLSSGAVFGRCFSQPVNNETQAMVSINDLKSSDWYSMSKLMTEITHRALSNLNIYDVRVYSYFSHSQSLQSGFFMSDVMKALVSNIVLETSSDNMTRDYMTPIDFFNVVLSIIKSAPQNLPLDCFTRSPIEKFDLLKRVNKDFGLQYVISKKQRGLNMGQSKTHYYSINKVANSIGYKPKYTSIDGICKEIKRYKF